MAGQSFIKNSFENIRANLLKFSGGHVLMHKDNDTGIAQIVLDRPEKCNAFSGQMMVELRQCVEELEQWNEGKALILTGKGKNFCSGGDLNFVRQSTPQGGFDMCTWMQDTLVRLEKLPLISCCLMHGATLGGGAELSVYCDYILAADDVKYGFLQGKLGIITSWGGGTRLVQRMGRKVTLDLLLRSRIINAQECLKIGLIEEIVPSDNALEKTVEWVNNLIIHDIVVTRAIKTVVLNAECNTLKVALELERNMCSPLWNGPLHKEMLKKHL
ncbi:hypothetical protein FQA39_LY18540 [Lamprigera yunnana]|nr:hypothetical protein FQA39_LY18540 [Lamprigera yunnana]